VDQKLPEGVITIDLCLTKLMSIEPPKVHAERAVDLGDDCIFRVSQDRWLPTTTVIVFERQPDTARVDQLSPVMLPEHLDVRVAAGHHRCRRSGQHLVQ